MSHADALSRNHLNNTEPVSKTFVFRIEATYSELTEQLSDDNLKVIHKILRQNTVKDEYDNQIHRDYKVIDNEV